MLVIMRIWIEIKYWFRRKFWQIRNIIHWMPILWNQYDFDYIYAIKVFRFQLLKMAKFLDSDKACTISSGDKSKDIKKVIELMDKIYDDKYHEEYVKHIESVYGKYDIKFKGGEMKKVWEKKYNSEELTHIDEIEKELIKKYNKKENDDHKLLWKTIEKNIRDWWD